MNNIKKYKKILRKEEKSNNLIKYNLLDRIREIRLCLENGLWLSAITLTMTLPDICGKIEFANDTKQHKHYIKWINKYVRAKSVYPKISQKGDAVCFDTFTPEIFYQLRCSVIHEGSTNLCERAIKDYPFISHEDFSHKYQILFSIRDMNDQSNFIRGTGTLSNLKNKTESLEVTVSIPALCRYVCNQAEKHYEKYRKVYDKQAITLLDYY